MFVNLPTSFGKSIIYQLAPLVSSRLEELSPNSGLGKSDAILVVVSPLISLTKARFPREGTRGEGNKAAALEARGVKLTPPRIFWLSIFAP